MSKLTYIIINKNKLKITTTDFEMYKNIISIMRENGLIGHTFNRKDMKYKTRYGVTRGLTGASHTG